MTLAARLRAGEVILSGWSLLRDPLGVELIARLGFDAVLMDMQHGGHDESSVLAAIGPLHALGSPAMVRIPVGRFDMASRALDMGAEAIVAPMINSVAEARAFAEASKLPPIGYRSWGPFRAMQLGGIATGQEYLEIANGANLALAMIETRRALEIAGDILAVDGIDGILVGPSDLSIDWTDGKRVDPALPEMLPALERLAALAAAAGKVASIFAGDISLSGAYVRLGYRLLGIGNEARFMRDGAVNVLAEVRRSIAEA